tara:strand:+ start:2802 stop:3077 length:276 start_codon:yes stop_codon:yes gene_type:complete
MTTRLLVLGNESYLPATTGAATSLSEARVVRLFNNSTDVKVVSIVETQSGTGIGSFTMPGKSVEILEKEYSHCLFASDASTVLATKVGFTN